MNTPASPPGDSERPDPKGSTPAHWRRIVKHMTDARLSLDLHRIADNVRFYGAEQRAAILHEAAQRLGPKTDQPG